ncbi:EAL domain-containing protein [Massilia forsythiae]|uniref:EAL domain-containing protein n=2 Tax=Massilia forsythiae TaxID=2728020 RepID=A0A7Z2W286_9BURK|nr:EAL domain-containing protein [Massilia forsythiae]
MAGQLDSGIGAERLRHEQEQARYNELHLLAPFGYFVVGIDGRILQANLAGARMLGIVRAGTERCHFRDFVRRAWRPGFDAFFEAALNSRTPQRHRLEMTCVDGGLPAPVKLLASADGSAQACRIVVEPVEPQDQLAALERSEERFRRIVHCAGEGIWEIDAFGFITFVNPKMAALLGCDIEDLIEQPLVRFMDEEGRARFEAHDVRRPHAQGERVELKFVRRDGAELWTSAATTPLFDAAGHYLGALALVSDITRQRASAERIWHQANYDELTGLPNRHMFRDRLRQEMHKADRGAGFAALLFIDLDHFKEVNDRLGHAVGDALLAEAARRVKGCVRASDTLARLGGDEFTVILAGLDRVASVDRIAQAIIDALAHPFDLQGESASVSASVGIALYPADARGLPELLSYADQAMYAAKNAGCNRYSYFTPDLQEAALARQAIARELRQALAEGQFEILYQPIVSLRSNSVHKAEALLRWRHPQRGLLAPAQFIPFAESSGLIVEIGDWVFREAARQAQRWQRSIAPGFQVSVNKSPVQFRRDAALYQGWVEALRELALPPRSLVMEISESTLLDGAERVVERLGNYQALGLQVALDHFGTGHASLAHLKRYAIDFVKIDSSLAALAESDNSELALVGAIVAMAHKLGLEVVAEGVETPAQRMLLKEAGCDYAQGFIFGKPMTALELETLAANRMGGAA